MSARRWERLAIKSAGPHKRERGVFARFRYNDLKSRSGRLQRGLEILDGPFCSQRSNAVLCAMEADREGFEPSIKVLVPIAV